MKIFHSIDDAITSFDNKEKIFMNSFCPFNKERRLCGNWCALFYYYKGNDKESPYVILGCKGTDKHLYL